VIDFRGFIAATSHEDGSRSRTPYPWQEALAARLADGEPPWAIAVPTGGGKTTTVDALIWALAIQAERPAHERTVGVRTVWAIDRRILVDEVYEHATRLAQRLSSALDDRRDVLHEMARRLQSIAGLGAQPLTVTRWRGGLPREARAHSPLQPEVITSTVAQIGSRLLFRGYGVGERSLALEAGLAAVDTTVCLDEAHLAEPFRQTVEAIRAIRDDEPALLPRLRMVTLTATPATAVAETDVHTIGEADRDALGARLVGEKAVQLTEPASDRRKDQTAALLEAVESHLDEGANRLACVVNSVGTAVDVHDALAARRPEAHRLLLVGPQRPADRQRMLEEYRDRLFGRATGSAPLVCVATQTFEVGLDADVEALVTQSASASAIVQRLGRLNRAGLDRGRATIVRDTQSRLYAEDEAAAWAWLSSLQRSDGTIDMSVRSLEADRTRPAPARSPLAPELTAEVVDLLVQTAPRPARMADPDVEVFLRGATEDPSSDVTVCWRCDLRIDEPGLQARTYRQALLRLMPPTHDETVTLSIAKAHALLATRLDPRSRAAAASTLDTADVEGADEGTVPLDALPAPQEGDSPTRFVLLRGREYHEVSTTGGADGDLRLRDIRPGDLIVLSTSVGGYANGALAPSHNGRVKDVGADLLTDRRAPLTRMRLSREVLEELRYAKDDIKAVLRQASIWEAGNDSGLFALCDLLGAQGAQLRQRDDLKLRRLTADTESFLGDLGAEPLDLDSTIFADETPAREPAFVLLASATTLEEIRPSAVPPPTLDAHATDVVARAGSFIRGLNLPDHVASAVTLAARAHDHGKGDPRFQTFFRAGVPALLAAPIAKSVFGTADVQAERAARVAAGLPRGLRHEIASVAALADALAHDRVDDLPADVDVELALHLVGCHHGLGRPVPRAPRMEGSAARQFAVDAAGIQARASGDAIEGWDDGAWLRRFFATIERYGPWGTAYLEALLILADRAVSREGA
jgi:CRISPR-associated endonuclease/helicase Cas3